MIKKNKLKTMIPYLLIFAFWMTIFGRIPLIHDAWAGNGLYYGSNTLINWIRSVLPLYNTLNGRMLATILVGFFERKECILDLVNAIFLTLIPYFYQKCFETPYKYIPLCVLMALLIVPVGTRTEVYFYAACIYILPILYILLFYLYYRKYISNKISWTIKETIIFLVICYINASWIEHTSFAFMGMFVLLFSMRCWKSRHFDFKLFLFLCISGIGFVSMLLSPGLRINRTFSIVNKKFSTQIFENIILLIRFLTTEQGLILFMLAVMCLLLTLKWLSKVRNIFLKILFLISPILWGVISIKEFVRPNSILLQLPNSLLLAMGLSLIIFLLQVLYIIYNSKSKLVLLIFYFTGVLSLVPVIVTPNFSYRVSHYFIIMINFITIGFILEYCQQKATYYHFMTGLMMMILFIFVDSYFIVTSKIQNTQNIRESLITDTVEAQRKGEWDYDNVLILPLFAPGQLYADASPQNFYDPIHYQVFLAYYKLDSKTLVWFGNSYDKLIAILDKDNSMKLTIKPAHNNVVYNYQYYMYNNGVLIEQSGITSSDTYCFTVPDQPGRYYFACSLIDDMEQVLSTYSPNIVTRN